MKKKSVEDLQQKIIPRYMIAEEICRKRYLSCLLFEEDRDYSTPKPSSFWKVLRDTFQVVWTYYDFETEENSDITLFFVTSLIFFLRKGSNTWMNLRN